jgi:hypothetical protein
MATTSEKIQKIIYAKCGCRDSSIEAVSMITALIEAEQKPMVKALKATLFDVRRGHYEDAKEAIEQVLAQIGEGK